MEFWQRVNETLAVVAWPVIVGIALISQRAPIGRFIERVKTVRAFGGELSSTETAVTRDANRALAATAAAELRKAADAEPSTHEAPRSDDALIPRELGVYEPEVPEPAQEPDRVTVEKIARTFARAGWKLGSSGVYESAPTPQFDWDDEGSLQITGWAGEKASRTPAHVSTSDTVEKLERAIQELDLELRRTPTSSTLVHYDDREAKASQLAELQRVLSVIDPMSPWAQVIRAR